MAKHTLTFTVQQIDGDGQILARRLHSVTESAPLAGDYRQGYATGTSQVTLDLPYTQIRQFIFFNTHASAKFTIVATPQGGAQATINTVGPGGAMIFFDPTVTGTSGVGFSSIKVTSDTTGGTYEYFLGG